MGGVFVVLAYLRHGGGPVEVGRVSSYDEASGLVREWIGGSKRVWNVSFFRIEVRYHV